MIAFVYLLGFLTVRRALQVARLVRKRRNAETFRNAIALVRSVTRRRK